MKTWQKILLYAITPLLIIDHLITFYYIDKGLGTEGNPIINFIWNYIDPKIELTIMVIFLILGTYLIIRNYDKLPKWYKVIINLGIIWGVTIRIFAIIGWLKIGGIL